MEGVQYGGDLYQNEGYILGGNLSQVRNLGGKVVLKNGTTTITNKLVYSTHDYPNGNVCGRPWMRGALWSGKACADGYASAGFPGNLPAVWNYFWGFIYNQNIAPLYLGEFGTLYSRTRAQFSGGPTYDLPQDRAWLRGTDASYTDPVNPQGGLVKYLKDKPNINWSFFSLEPNSDPGGILGDCTNINTGNPPWSKIHVDKLNAIRTIMSPSKTPLNNSCP